MSAKVNLEAIADKIVWWEEGVELDPDFTGIVIAIHFDDRSVRLGLFLNGVREGREELDTPEEDEGWELTEEGWRDVPKYLTDPTRRQLALKTVNTFVKKYLV